MLRGRSSTTPGTARDDVGGRSRRLPFLPPYEEASTATSRLRRILQLSPPYRCARPSHGGLTDQWQAGRDQGLSLSGRNKRLCACTRRLPSAAGPGRNLRRLYLYLSESSEFPMYFSFGKSRTTVNRRYSASAMIQLDRRECTASSNSQRVPVGEICKTSGSWMAKSRSWGEISDPQDLEFMGTWGTGR